MVDGQETMVDIKRFLSRQSNCCSQWETSEITQTPLHVDIAKLLQVDAGVHCTKFGTTDGFGVTEIYF